jgi:3',5'-cyclic-AMP phosphodiesterase
VPTFGYAPERVAAWKAIRRGDGIRGQSGERVSRRPVIRLAQLSDMHLVGEAAPHPFGQDTAASLAAVIDELSTRPDVAVMTGDLTDDGSLEAYHRVRAHTAGLADEVHAVPGNHDDPANMYEVLGGGRDDVRLVSLSRRWTMLLVNSQWLGHDAGRIAPETLDAIDEALARASQHVIACMHHPPASTCNDPYCGIVNGAQTLSVLRRHRQLRAVLSGHLHRAFDDTHAGIRFLGAPSTCCQLTHGGVPHFAPTSAPPAARLVDLHSDGAVTYQSVSARYTHAGP